MGRFRSSTRGVLSVLAAATLLCAGCGVATHRPTAATGGCVPAQASEQPDPQPLTVTEAVLPAAANQVPPAIRARGGITVAADAAYPPNEFTQPGSNRIIGMDVDLGTAIGQVLGVPVHFVNASFDGILAGIQAGRYDLGMSSFSDTAQRERTVDFVTYFQAGTATMVRACNPRGIRTELDLCGRIVGAENGTIQLDQITRDDVPDSLVARCRDASAPPPKGMGFPKQTDVNSALLAGRIDAYLADTPVIDYALRKTGAAFQKAGEARGVAPYGIAVAKAGGTTNGDTMTIALRTALQHLMTDGTYRRVLDNWGVADGAITRSSINGAR